MTATVLRSSPALTIPPTQNTALVLEYRCLFTHDIRRKQKRWQDGFLKFHTFNRRVMVYDVSRNFVGDMHCAQGQDPQEGDEIELDKACVIVQVDEPVGRTDTDLTELLEKRARKPNINLDRRNKGPVANLSSSPSAGPSPLPSRTTPRPSLVAPQQFQKHRSLNALLGTPKGRIGKAVLPDKSPFELRHQAEGQDIDGWASERSPKRRKTQGTEITRVTKPSARNNAGSVGQTAQAVRQRADIAHKKPGSIAKGQAKLPMKEVIDLCSDDAERPASRPSLPMFSRLPQASISTTRATTNEPKTHESIEEANQRHRSPPVRSANRISAKEEPVLAPAKQSTAERQQAEEAADREERQGAPLRIISTAPRRMLICQKPTPRVHKATSPASVAAHAVKKSAPLGSADLAVPHSRGQNQRCKSPTDSSRTVSPSIMPVENDGVPQPTTKGTGRARLIGSPALQSLEPNVPARKNTTDLTSNKATKPSAKAPPPKPPSRRAGDAVKKTKSTFQPAVAVVDAEIVPQIIQMARNKSRANSAQNVTSRATSEGHNAATGKQSLGLKTGSGPPVSARRDSAPEAAKTKPMPKTSTVAPPRVVEGKDMDVGPWSTEAFDLFDWRPPDRREGQAAAA